MKIRTTLYFDDDDRRIIGKQVLGLKRLANRAECLEWAQQAIALRMEEDAHSFSDPDEENE